jgi:hypothetical protein
MSRKCKKYVIELFLILYTSLHARRTIVFAEALFPLKLYKTVSAVRCRCRILLHCFFVALCAVLATLPVNARGKSSPESYGEGLSVSVPAPEQELLQAVQDVVADGIIQGTKEYNKDQYVAGAEAADTTHAFTKWSGSGHVFYKIKKNALDPRNFKDTSDSGTLAVRYVVQPGDGKNTLLKIDAIFVDDYHHRDHLSNGSVESAEYKDIQDHIAAMQLRKTEAAEEEQRHQQQLAAQELERKRKQRHIEQTVTRAPDESLQQHVERLRHDVERQVKSPGTQLKSAPFKSASSLQSLAAGTRVAILISTPYWYGVETESGQHGWIHRSQLEQLP